MSIEVTEVSNSSSLKKFLELPFEIYKDDPFSVRPTMDYTISNYLQNPINRKNIKLFLASRENLPVARVAALIDPHYSQKVGFFGFFEAFEDLEASGKIFSAAFNWLKNNNKKIILGPVAYSINQLIGVLTEGFSEEPSFMTPYNPPYYSLLLNNLGFDKAEDFYAYRWHHGLEIPSKLLKVAQRAKRISGLKIRTISFRHLGREAEILSDVFNQSMVNNWGYRPLSYRDSRQILNDYKSYADPDLISIIEINRRPAAISLGIPNIQPLLKEYPQGLPIPLTRSVINKIKTLRLVILGVKPPFRCRGLEALMILHTIKTAQAKGYMNIEASLIHEKNTMMNKILSQVLGCPKIKGFRLYQKELKKVALEI